MRIHANLSNPSAITEPAIIDTTDPASVCSDAGFLAEMRRAIDTTACSDAEAPAIFEAVKQAVLDLRLEDLALIKQVLSYRGPATSTMEWLPASLESAFAIQHAEDLGEYSDHTSGCARGEVFRTLTNQERMIHVMIKRGSNMEKSKLPMRTSAAMDKKEESRATRAEHRRFRVATEDLQNVDMLKYSQLKGRRKKLRFEPSQIHGWGLFTLEDIPAGEMVVEYVGELVRPVIADRREVHYTRKGIGSSYLFRLADVGIVDATKTGGVGRFMNHSCNVSDV